LTEGLLLSLKLLSPRPSGLQALVKGVPGLPSLGERKTPHGAFNPPLGPNHLRKVKLSLLEGLLRSFGPKLGPIDVVDVFVASPLPEDLGAILYPLLRGEFTNLVRTLRSSDSDLYVLN